MQALYSPNIAQAQKQSKDDHQEELLKMVDIGFKLLLKASLKDRPNLPCMVHKDCQNSQVILSVFMRCPMHKLIQEVQTLKQTRPQF